MSLIRLSVVVFSLELDPWTAGCESGSATLLWSGAPTQLPARVGMIVAVCHPSTLPCTWQYLAFF